jgi:hypothetical protein
MTGAPTRALRDEALSLLDRRGSILEPASRMRNMLRAQDLADVIGLIRHNGLTSEYAKNLDKSLRPTFRKLVKAIQQEGGC